MKGLSLIFLITLLFLLPWASAAGQWHEASGPLGVGGVAHAIDPLDADSIYVGGRVLFHSEDGGKIYEKVTGLPQFNRMLPIRSIAISRDKEGPIILGTYEPQLIISEDRGKTWQKLTFDEKLGSFDKTWAGPAGSKVFYAINEQGVKRSSDNGRTWEFQGDLPEQVKTIWFPITDRFDVSTMSFMHFEGLKAFYFMSRDGGKSFKEVAFPKGEDFIASASTDPENRKLLYVCAQENGRGGGYRKRFYHSYDEGKTWDVYWDPALGDEIPEAVDKNLKLVMPEMLVSPLPDKFRSMPPRCSLSWSEDKPGRIISSIDGGIVRSDDFGKTWESANQGLINTSIRQIVIDPNDPKSGYCTYFQNVMHTGDLGKTWTKMPVNGGRYPIDVKYSPDGRSVFVVSYGIWKGTSDGAKWKKVWTPESYKHAHGVLLSSASDGDDGKTTQEMFFIGNGILLKSVDGGDTWDKACDSDLELRPRNKRVVAVRTTIEGKETWYIKLREIKKSEDRGKTWEDAMPGIGRGAAAIATTADGDLCLLTDIFLEIRGEETVRVSFGKTGRKWRASATALVCDPADRSTAYIGLYHGRILRTTDSGKTLVELEGGPVGVRIFSMAISPKDGTLWVGTGGNGVWLLENPKKHPTVSSEK